MKLLKPIRKVRIEQATGNKLFDASEKQTFEYSQFEPGTYTKSPLTYMHQNGQVMPYAVREEVIVDLVEFTDTQLNLLFAWELIDVEVTLGFPDEASTMIYFYAVKPQLNLNITEGVQKLKFSVQQFATDNGDLTGEYYVAKFGYGTHLGAIDNIVEMPIIGCRVGLQVIKLPYRNGLYADIERIIGYKRTAVITLSPKAANSMGNGFNSAIETWLFAPYKNVWARNFFADTVINSTDVPRLVVCTNSEEIVEERLDNLYQGRNITIEVIDRNINFLPV